MQQISIEDFQKIELRIGRIIEVEDLPKAKKPIYKIVVDFGDFGKKVCCAGIKDSYSKKDLLNKLVVAVVNLKPKKIAGVTSEAMLLAAVDDSGKAVLLVPDKEVKLGCRIF